MSGIVYILCALTALACAVLLLRGYSASGARLLLWSGLCFVGLTVNNALVFVDLYVVPDHNLLLARNLSALLAISLLLFGLVWDSKQ
jgi:hypothetical protein